MHPKQSLLLSKAFQIPRVGETSSAKGGIGRGGGRQIDPRSVHAKTENRRLTFVTRTKLANPSTLSWGGRIHRLHFILRRGKETHFSNSVHLFLLCFMTLLFLAISDQITSNFLSLSPQIFCSFVGRFKKSNLAFPKKKLNGQIACPCSGKTHMSLVNQNSPLSVSEINAYIYPLSSLCAGLLRGGGRQVDKADK